MSDQRITVHLNRPEMGTYVGLLASGPSFQARPSSSVSYVAISADWRASLRSAAKPNSRGSRLRHLEPAGRSAMRRLSLVAVRLGATPLRSLPGSLSITSSPLSPLLARSRDAGRRLVSADQSLSALGLRLGAFLPPSVLGLLRATPAGGRSLRAKRRTRSAGGSAKSACSASRRILANSRKTLLRRGPLETFRVPVSG